MAIVVCELCGVIVRELEVVVKFKGVELSEGIIENIATTGIHGFGAVPSEAGPVVASDQRSPHTGPVESDPGAILQYAEPEEAYARCLQAIK